MFAPLEAKAVAAVFLGGGSLIAGLLPNWLGLAERIEHSLFLSIILCFGAGVLLSTSVLHILHDTVTALPNWGEIFFCSGFMALYFVDELVQFFCLITVECENSQTIHHHHHYSDPSEEDRLLEDKNNHSKYGSIKNVSSPERKSKLLSEPSVEGHSRQLKFEECCPEVVEQEEKIEWDVRQEAKNVDSQLSVCRTFTDPTIKAKNKTVKKMGLVTALCIHSVLEGLAVGTQPTSSKVIVLLLAVSCHKLVITFCLGAELVSDGCSFAALLGSLSIYAVSSGIGVLIGIVMNSTNTAVIPLLQGLAGGSLLYITIGEILPRERFHKSHCNMPKTTGLIQFLSVLLGIIPVAVMNVYLDSDDY